MQVRPAGAACDDIRRGDSASLSGMRADRAPLHGRLGNMMVRLAVVGVKGGVRARVGKPLCRSVMGFRAGEAGHDTRPRVAYHRRFQ